MQSGTNFSKSGINGLAFVTAIATFLACNGIFILIAIFAAAGITLVVNPHVQAAFISLFAVTTVILIFISYRANKILQPLLLSVAGAIIVVATMYIHYDKIIESAGLLVLFISAIWSWWVRDKTRKLEAD